MTGRGPMAAAVSLREGDRRGRFVVLRDSDGAWHAVAATAVAAVCEAGDGGASCVLRVQLVVAEAKFVADDGAAEQAKHSMEQLAATFATLHDRFVREGGTVDPATWRNRLADLVLEHMDPFDQVGGRPYAEWLGDLRDPEVALSMSGHSIVFVHNRTGAGYARPVVPEADDERAGGRPRLAQWVFQRGPIARSLRALAAGARPATTQLWTPPEWDADGGTGAAAGSPPEPDVVAAATGLDPAPTAAAVGRGAEVVEEMLGFVARPPDAAPGLAAPLATAAAAAPESGGDGAPGEPGGPPAGWLPGVHATVSAMARPSALAEGDAWLKAEVERLRQALRREGMDAPVVSSRLTPNSGLVELDGKAVTVAWLERNRTDLMTRHGVQLIRVSPKPGRVLVALQRPKRAVLRLADAWLRRALAPDAPRANVSPVVGEREDDGELLYLPLGGSFGDQDRAAPHAIISGGTGSGKGILATNLLLDLAAFNDPRLLRITLIDPKRGVDYGFSRGLPHMVGDTVGEKPEAVEVFRKLVREMEDRYEALAHAGAANIDEFNARAGSSAAMPRLVVLFDEVANWMQDRDFAGEIEPLINEIATKSRASGIHLFMMYQRADNQVMSMQLRANLGNKLVLRLVDEGSSRIVLNDASATSLLGKGHMIAKLESDERIYCQVPFIAPAEAQALSRAIAEGWARASVALADAAKAA